ncbi:MAG TPA: metallophosphoesterase [Candidatus Saccharimonadales bacterium]|nr:metallophosphoesterase [Candidatus Saccharimonadales bacterium]
MSRRLLPAPWLALLALACLLPAPGRGAAAPPAPAGPAGSQGPLADLMRKQPYLIFPGDPTRMEVLWQLTASATSTLEWGPDTACSGGTAASAEYGGDHQHAYTIPGLSPGARYYYRVTTGGSVYRGSFSAAPPPEASRVKFLASGDTRSYPARDDQVTAAMAAAFAADSAFQTMALFMGDFVEFGNEESSWTEEFFDPAYPSIRRLMVSLPYQAAMGNHEDASPVLFTKYFPYPWVGGRYWSFDYGPAHVAVVDQYTSYGPGSAQLDWLTHDLETSAKPWKFVLLHEPGWSAGGGHSNNPGVQSYIQPLCEQYGVAILFAGHNHYYARAVVNGVVHITTGGGGAPSDTPDLPAAHVVTATEALHFCKIAIDGAALSFQAVTPGGALLDSFTLHQALPDSVPPTALLQVPNGGEQWTQGTPHAIQYVCDDNVGVDSVNLDYSLHAAAGPWLPIQHRLVQGSGSHQYLWTVPPVASYSALVRVTAFDHARNQCADVGDSLFRIASVPLDTGGSGPAVLALARPRPNPSSGMVWLRYSLPDRGTARLEVMDAAGRRVRTVDAGLRAAGWQTAEWDGCGASGKPVPAGLYLVRLVSPSGTRTVRLIRLK